MCCTWTSIWDAITLSKIQYLNIALGGTAALYAAPSSICTDLIVDQANLIFQAALYCSAFGSMLHKRCRLIFLRVWHRCAFGNRLGYLVHWKFGISSAALHTSYFSNDLLLGNHRRSTWALCCFSSQFYETRMDPEPLPSFRVWGFFVLCIYFVQYFEEVLFYCQVLHCDALLITKTRLHK